MRLLLLASLLASLALPGCDAFASPAPDEPSDARTAATAPSASAGHAGTHRMATRLAELAERTDPLDNEYLNRRRAAVWAQRIEEAGGVDAAPLALRLSQARELLLAGDPRFALGVFEEAEAKLAALGEMGNPDMLAELRHMQVLAWLRLGEQENCLEHHTLASCLVPIQGDGQHTRTEGSERAYALLLDALQRDGNDWESRWLLNLTAMTLGRWPDDVPEAWRLAPEVFASEHAIGRFVDASQAAGVNVVGLAGGVAMEDFDGDGRLDLLVSSWGMGDPLTLLVNQGDGSFADRTADAGLDGITGGLNMLHADADNDGDADVLVLRGAWFEKDGGHFNSLLDNRGSGLFADVTEEVGLLSGHPTQTAAWGDYDGDGWLDLFIGNETGPHAVHPCELFHNEGGTFTDVAPKLGMNLTGYVKGTSWGDIDNDGDLDLYISRIDGSNWLLRNDGPRRQLAPEGEDASAPDGAPVRGAPARFRRWTFTDISAAAGVGEPERSFPTWFFDYDNDGWLDIFVSGFRYGSTGWVIKDYLGLPSRGVRAKLYRNRGDGTFEDAAEAAGLSRVLPAMGANFGDIDCDGWPDIYLATGEPDFGAVYPNRMFRNDRGTRFQDVTTAGGFGHIQKGHAIAFGDLDADGDQDIYAVMGGAYEADVFPNALFLNPSQGQRWITVRLQGVAANRSAIGARLRVRIVEDLDGQPRERDVHTTVNTGGSFGSSSLQAEIGLGAATEILELEVRWPGSGRVDRLHDVPLDRVLALREGDDRVTVVESAPMPLGR